MSHCLLTLIVAPAAEDLVAEWLLEDDAVTGFASTPISGHGSSEQSMTLAEQVAGRRRRVMFLTHLESAAAEGLLERLRRDFAGADMHYWITPVTALGRLG
jgi:hypothetical protein